MSPGNSWNNFVKTETKPDYTEVMRRENNLGGGLWWVELIQICSCYNRCRIITFKCWSSVQPTEKELCSYYAWISICLVLCVSMMLSRLEIFKKILSSRGKNLTCLRVGSPWPIHTSLPTAVSRSPSLSQICSSSPGVRVHYQVSLH